MSKPAKVWQISHTSNPKEKSSKLNVSKSSPAYKSYIGTANQEGGELIDLIPMTISTQHENKKVSRDETRSEEDEQRRVVGDKVGWLNTEKIQPHDIHAEENARKFDSDSGSSTVSSITYEVKSTPKRQAAEATFEDEPQQHTLPNDKIQFKKKAQPLMMLKTRLNAGKKKEPPRTNRPNVRSSAWDVDPEMEDSTVHTWGDDTTQTSGYTEHTYTTGTRTLDSEFGKEETDESLSLLYELAITLKETVSGELDELGRQVEDGRNKGYPENHDPPSTIDEGSQDWYDGSINGSEGSKIANPDWDSVPQFEIIDHKIDAIQQFRSKDQADDDWCNDKKEDQLKSKEPDIDKKEEKLKSKDPDIDIESAGIKKLSVSFSLDIESKEDDSFEDESFDGDESMTEESQKNKTTQPTNSQSCFEQIASFFGGSCCAADTSIDNSILASVSSKLKKKEERFTHFAVPRKQGEENDMTRTDKSQANDTDIQEGSRDQKKKSQAITKPDSPLLPMIRPCGSLEDILDGSDTMTYPSANFMLPTHQQSTIIEVEQLEDDVEADDSTVAAGASAREKHANDERFSPPCEVIVEEDEDDKETFNDMMESYYASLDPNIKPSTANLDPNIKPSSAPSAPKSYVWQICNGKLVRVEKETEESDIKPNTKKGKTKTEKDAKGEVQASSFKTDINKRRAKNATAKIETPPRGVKKEANGGVVVSSFKSDVTKGKSKNTVKFEAPPKEVKEEGRYRPNRTQRTVSYVKPRTRAKQSSTQSVNNMSPSTSTTRRKEFKGSIAHETDKAMSDAIEKRIRSGMKEDREDVGERNRKSALRNGPKKTTLSRRKDPTEPLPEDLFAAKLAQLQRETSQQLSETRKLVADTHAQTELWTPKSMRNRS